MTEQEINIASEHFKNLYVAKYFLKYSFFRELLSSKGPNLKELIEEGEACNFDASQITNYKIGKALKQDIPNAATWLGNLYEEFKELKKTVDYTSAYAAKYDPSMGAVTITRFLNKFNENVAKNIPTLSHIMKTLGPPIWKDLHTYAKTWDGNAEDQQQFIEKVKNRIPCGECKSFWIRETKDNPAPSDSADSFFKWTVDVHNKVNVKLGKPEMLLEDVLALY